MAKAGLIMLLFACISCGPRWHVRQAEKHIAKAEQLGATWGSDTVFRTIEIPVPEVRVDSTIVIKPGDSVVIFKDRLEVKYKRLAGDTVFIEAACLPDTVEVEVVHYVNRELNCPPCKFGFFDIVKGFLLGLVLGFIAYRVYRIFR